MEDFYFERIAGVGERQSEARRPQGAEGAPTMTMGGGMDDDVGADIDLNATAQPTVEGSMDDNGFPTSPLRDQEDLWFVQAAGLYKPIAKGAATARASGMFMLVSGVLTMLFGLLAVNVVTIVIGLVFAVLGTIERGAGNDMALAKASAPTRLAINQLLIFGLVAGSCFMSLKDLNMDGAQAMTESEAQIAQLPAEAQGVAQQMAQQMAEMGPSIVYTIFGAVAALSLIFQGTMAAYYLSRRRKIRDFDDELPPWVGDIVRTVAAR
jgi:hypothetical protein